MSQKTLFPGLAALTLALAALAAGGCDEVAFRGDVVLSDSDCSRWRCGYNTSEINGKSLQELHLGGAANPDGVRLVGFIAPQGLLGYKLAVDGDELIAKNGLLGTLRGPQLIGATLLVKLEPGLVVPVVIASHEEVDSWAEGGAPVPAYGLVYADLNQPLLQRSVCKGTLVDPLQAAVVILADERYDLASKTVLADQSGWITLGCAGSATAKMSLLGYGPSADFDGEGDPASPAQRQATLKMITGDYCGGGTSYTVDGTPLHWENQSGSVSLPAEVDPASIEAIWTADGALCLDTPRVVDPGDVACALPSCAGLSLADGEWATYVAE